MLISEFLSRLPAFACALGLTSATVLMSTTSTEAQTMKPTILLVHGAWADSSSWNGVVDLLLKDGYEVRALPNTLRGLEADAAVISAYLKTVSGSVVLVGHSYGGLRHQRRVRECAEREGVGLRGCLRSRSR